MHKYLISLMIFLLSASSIAADKLWSNLEVGKSYTISKELTLTDGQSTFVIKPNSKLVLKERTSLGMIKVELYKFNTSLDCPSEDMTTDIQLEEIIQSNGKKIVVGFDLVEDCTLEAFVEFVDINTHSIFN